MFITNELPNLSPLESSNTGEWVRQTEVGNFESNGWMTNEQIADYLREIIPPTHLENVPFIRYDELPDPNYPNALGLFDPNTHGITIHGPSERLLQNEGGVTSVITHEIGHNVHQNMLETKPELARQWAFLHLNSFAQEGGFVSTYAVTNVYEDFAESYKYYVTDPERLHFFNPEKCEFMRDIFSGQEYPLAKFSYWDSDSQGNRIEVTQSGVYDLKGNKIADSL